MNKDAVQNERQPRSCATVPPELHFGSSSKGYIKASATSVLDPSVNDVTVGVFSPFYTLPAKFFPPVHVDLSKFQNLEGLEEETTMIVSKATHGNAHAPVQDTLIVDPEVIKQESKFNLTKESIYDTSFRIFQLTVRWARNLPSFPSLCIEDQFILLEETWSELFLLNVLQWGLPLDSNPLLSAIETTSCKLPEGHRHNLRLLQKAFSRFKILTIDLAEFACLKAIILFKPEYIYCVNRGILGPYAFWMFYIIYGGRLKDSYQVEMLQDHAQLMLAHHIKTHHIDYTLRFGRLLLLLPILRQISSESIEVIFFNNIGCPLEKLLSDMFKR